MTLGPTEQAVIQQAIRNHHPIPEKIENAPELQIGLEFYYRAFLELSSCRSIGFGEGPIPWSAVDRYCVYYRIKGEDREDLFYHIHHLDVAYLAFQAEKSKKGGGNQNGNKKDPP